MGDYFLDDHFSDIVQKDYDINEILSMGCWLSDVGNYILPSSNRLRGIDLVFEKKDGRWRATRENMAALGLCELEESADAFSDTNVYYFLKFENERREEERRRGLRPGALIGRF